jgi:arylsulfatase A-like enzyme
MAIDIHNNRKGAEEAKEKLNPQPRRPYISLPSELQGASPARDDKSSFLNPYFLCALCVFAVKSVIYAQERPNFVFFLVDDLGWADIGANNPGTFYETPNIDQLAAEGMRFTNGYAASPVCSPTRSSIMVGQNPARNNLTQWIGGAANPAANPPYIHELPLEDTTLAEALKEAGYITFFAGKWHLGETEEYWPEFQGFDINKGGHDKGSPPGGYFAPWTNPRLENGPDGEHLPYRLGDESIAFLDSAAQGDAPFLLYLAFYSVHTPLQSTDELRARYEAKADTLTITGPETGDEHGFPVKLVQNHPVFAGMVESMDANVGRVLDKLQELGLEDGTVVIFTSDNGGLSTTAGRLNTSNVPLRAGKGWVYEGGIRVPLIIKWPGVVEGGSVNDAMAVSMDFYPTMLEMADLPLKPDQHADGRSLVPLLKGEKTNIHSTLYFHYPHNHGAGHRPSSSLRVGDYKLINFLYNNEVEMYNLAEDISEKNNLSDSLPEVRDSLLGILQKWWSDVDARFPDGYEPVPGITPQEEPPVSVNKSSSVSKGWLESVHRSQWGVQYMLRGRTCAELSVFNSQGILIKKIYGNREHDGVLKVRWNYADMGGSRVCQGIYFIRISGIGTFKEVVNGS